MKNKRLLCIVLLGIVLIVTIPTYVRYSAKKEWQSKIYESIKNSNYHSFKELLSQGAKRKYSLDFSSEEKYTPLTLAIITEDENTILSLLKYGANPNFKDECGRSPLYASTYRNDDIPFLLIKCGADLKKSGRYYTEINRYISVFCTAAINGNNLKFVEYLLQKGENPDFSWTEDGRVYSLLYWACIYQKTDSIRLLLKYGAGPNKPDEELSQWYLFYIISAPMIAQNEKCALLELFFKHGAKVKPIPILNNGTTNILQYARKECSKEIIELLEKNLEKSRIVQK